MLRSEANTSFFRIRVLSQFWLALFCTDYGICTLLCIQRCCHFLLLENMNISIWIKPKSHKTMHSYSMAMLHDMRVGLLCDAYLTIWVRTTISSPKGLFPREILNSQITPLGRLCFFDRHWPWDIWSYLSRLLVKPNFFK